MWAPQWGGKHQAAAGQQQEFFRRGDVIGMMSFHLGVEFALIKSFQRQRGANGLVKRVLFVLGGFAFRWHGSTCNLELHEQDNIK